MIRQPQTSPLFPYTPLFRSNKLDLDSSRRECSRGVAAGNAVTISILVCLRDSVRIVGHPETIHWARDGRRDQIGLLVVTSRDRKSTRLNSSHLVISYAVFCL